MIKKYGCRSRVGSLVLYIVDVRLQANSKFQKLEALHKVLRLFDNVKYGLAVASAKT